MHKWKLSSKLSLPANCAAFYGSLIIKGDFPGRCLSAVNHGRMQDRFPIHPFCIVDYFRTMTEECRPSNRFVSPSAPNNASMQVSQHQYYQGTTNMKKRIVKSRRLSAFWTPASLSNPCFPRWGATLLAVVLYLSRSVLYLLQAETCNRPGRLTQWLLMKLPK